MVPILLVLCGLIAAVSLCVSESASAKNAMWLRREQELLQTIAGLSRENPARGLSRQSVYRVNSN